MRFNSLLLFLVCVFMFSSFDSDAGKKKKYSKDVQEFVGSWILEDNSKATYECFPNMKVRIDEEEGKSSFHVDLSFTDPKRSNTFGSMAFFNVNGKVDKGSWEPFENTYFYHTKSRMIENGNETELIFKSKRCSFPLTCWMKRKSVENIVIFSENSIQIKMSNEKELDSCSFIRK